MSSASLAVASRTHPDRVRIAAISAALALNLAALVLASRPLAPALPIAAPSSMGTPATLPPARTTADVPAAPGAAVPVEASLAYRSAPLQFPLPALRQRMHGLVLLRVLVDEAGRPVEVQVERSSGYPLLDRSAREQVLAGWRFQPAVLNGQRVRAWARVPVSFSLRPL